MRDTPDRSAGTTPILSSRSRGWTGIGAELLRVTDGEIVSIPDEHLVSVAFEGRARSCQPHGVAFREHDVIPREVTIMPAGSPMRWRYHGRGQLLHIAMRPAFLDNTMRAATGSTHAFRLVDTFGARDRVIEVIASSLLEELGSELPGGRTYVQAIATQLAFHLARHHATELDAAGPRLKMSAYQLRKVREFVETHLGDDVTIERMAAVAGCSPGHFAHCFKAETSISPHKYVMERRLQRAKALLRDTRLSLTEVASQAGYASASHLCVTFRAAEHMSPGECREQGSHENFAHF